MSILDLILPELRRFQDSLNELEGRLVLLGNLEEYPNNTISSSLQIHLKIYDSVTESSIQRFIITHQYLVDLLNKILGTKDKSTKTAKGIFIVIIEKFEYQIDNEEWQKITDFRNKITHHFDSRITRKWISKIKDYCNNFRNILILIKERNPEI